MDKMIEIKKDKTTKEKSESKETKEQFRVVISKEANESIEAVLKKTTLGFDAGEITKSDLANFVFKNLEKYFLESDMKALRTSHFDDKKMLGSLLKNSDDLPEDLKKAIRAHYGVTDKEKKKSQRPAQDLSIGSLVDKSKLPPVTS